MKQGLICVVIALTCAFEGAQCFSRVTSWHKPTVRNYRPSCGVADLSRNSNNFVALRSYSNYNNEESGGLSLKVVAVVVLGIFGLFGSELIGSVGNIQRTVVEQSKPASVQGLKQSSVEGNRGAMTRLTKREINAKLQQVPLFYLATDNGAVYTDGSNRGTFFAEKGDADKYMAQVGSKGSKVTVTAVTMDKVYYSLIAKKQKVGKFIEGVAGVSDPAAEYILSAAQAAVKQTPEGWVTTHEHDVPLFRVAGLAFVKDDGLEIPLFVSKDDALSAFARLKESKSKDSEDLLSATRGSSGSSSSTSEASSSPDVQVTSLLDLIQLFSTGGFEGRAIEIYPTIDAIEAAQDMLAPTSTNP